MRHLCLTLSILSVGLLTACNNEPAETMGGASQTGTSPGSSSSGPATEGPGTGGVTEGATGGATGSATGTTTGGETAGETMGGSVTAAPETGGTETETAAATEAPGTSTGADLCAGYVPPGCMQSGCREGEVCKVLEDECVSSSCSCDPGTGEEVCDPDCGGGSCVPACPDILCDLDCEFGFETDRDGCPICACAEGPPAECGCKSDKECVKTSSGCCPCNAGGDEVPAHMNCVDKVNLCDLPPEDVFCPQVYLCTDVQPACVAGQCVLI